MYIFEGKCTQFDKSIKLCLLVGLLQLLHFYLLYWTIRQIGIKVTDTVCSKIISRLL